MTAPTTYPCPLNYGTQLPNTPVVAPQWPKSSIGRIKQLETEIIAYAAS